MKTLLAIAIIGIGLASSQAQTYSTNDVRATWNVQMQLSTNQFLTWQYFWKKGTNGIVTPPAIDDSFRLAAKELVNVELARLAEVRKQEEQLKTDFAKLQAWWMEATTAQKTNVLGAAGLWP